MSTFVITGFDDFSKKEETGDAIKAVIAENSYAPEFVIVKEQVVATIASSFILHLDEIKNNLEKKNLKKAKQETDNQNSPKKEKGSSLSNTVNVPQTRSEPYTRRNNLKDINSQELLLNLEKFKSEISDDICIMPRNFWRFVNLIAS